MVHQTFPGFFIFFSLKISMDIILREMSYVWAC